MEEAEPEELMDIEHQRPLEQFEIEAANYDQPDLVNSKQSGHVRPITQVTAVTTPFDVSIEALNMDGGLAPIWNHYRVHRQDHPALPVGATQHVLALIAQTVGYMMRRGLKTGLMTCYLVSWLMKTDGEGNFWCSGPIRRKLASSPSSLSLSEALLFSALSGLDQPNIPFASASVIGGALVPIHSRPEEYRNRPVLRSMATVAAGGPGQGSSGPQSNTSPPAGSGGPAACGDLQAGASTATGSGGGRPRQRVAVQLAKELGPSVYLGTFDGKEAVLKLGTGITEVNRLKGEVEIYRVLARLQGQIIPMVYGNGWLSKDKTYFLAVEHIKGDHWDIRNTNHAHLSSKVFEAMARISQSGVCYDDLHAGNVLVTGSAIDSIKIIDFNGAVHTHDHARHKQLQTWYKEILEIRDEDADVVWPVLSQRTGEEVSPI